MSMLDDWYGPERARRIRAEHARRRRFAEAPSQTAVTQLTPEMRTVLEARMRVALGALKTAHAAALRVAENWPELNWKTALTAAYVPFLMPYMAAGVASGMVTTSEAKKQIVSALRSTMATQVAKREADMARVLSGQVSVTAWMTSVKETASGIASILKGLQENSLASDLMDTLDATWEDISSAIVWFGTTAREVGKKLPDAVKSYWPFVAIGGALLGGFILYQYATAPLRLLPPGERR